MTDEPVASASAIDQLADDLHRDATATNRATRLTVVAIVVALILGIVDLLGIALIWETSVQSRDNGRQVTKLLTNADPNSPRGRAAAAATEKVVIEIDCRNRRALAHLPPPDAGTPCVLP